MTPQFRPTSARRWKQRLWRGGLAALVVAGLTLAVSAPEAQAEPFDGEAFGVAALIETEGELELVAELMPTPLATFPPGETASLASVEVGEPPLPLLVTGVTEVSSLRNEATGVLTSSASVTDLSLSADTPPVLEASVLTATCTAEGEDDVAAEATISDLTVLGNPVTVTGEPNQVVVVAGLGTLTLNKQGTETNGVETGISAAAVVLDVNFRPVPELPPLTGFITIASVTCIARADEPPAPPTPPGPPGPPDEPGPPAPGGPVQALPRTGAETDLLAGLGVALLGLALGTVLVARRIRPLGTHSR